MSISIKIPEDLAKALKERFFRRICVDFGWMLVVWRASNARSSPQSSGLTA